MKWKNEIPNKTEFMKINSLNFIENEKYNTEMVHEKNYESFQNNYSLAERKSKVNVIEQDPEERRTMSETLTLTKTETDFTGSAPKKYITKCYLKQVNTPIWYTESVFLKIGSTKRIYSDKIYFKNKFQPFHWTESMSTEVKTGPKCIISDIYIPVYLPVVEVEKPETSL